MRGSRLIRRPAVRRGFRIPGAPGLVALLLLGAALLAGCSSTEPVTQHDRGADSDTVACATGGRAVAGLRDTFRMLSDELSGIGPASSRGDLAEVKRRLAQGTLLAEQVRATIDPAVAQLNSPLIRNVYQDVAAAGGQLRDALTALTATLDGGGPGQGATDAIGAALNSLNGAMNRMRTACPTVFPEPEAPVQTVRQAGG